MNPAGFAQFGTDAWGLGKMDIGDMPLFAALREKMRWHQTRQSLLSENVANANTPGYRGRDLRPFEFQEHIRNLSTARIETATTDARHISVASADSEGFGPRRMENYAITPDGNGVMLEDEMMKVAANQMDYQAITTLYTRSLRVIRTALGRQA